MRAFLRVTDNDSILIRDLDGQIADREVRTLEDLSYFLMPFSENGVICGFQHSSSMDFPEEYTSDPEVLAAITWIMGGGDPALTEQQQREARWLDMIELENQKDVN